MEFAGAKFYLQISSNEINSRRSWSSDQRISSSSLSLSLSSSTDEKTLEIRLCLFFLAASTSSPSALFHPPEKTPLLPFIPSVSNLSASLGGRAVNIDQILLEMEEKHSLEGLLFWKKCRSDPKAPSMAIAIAIFSILLATFLLLSLTVVWSRRNQKKSVGFFHPYTNDGGGGERVLWCAVRAIQEENPGLECAVFTGDDASPESLSIRARDRFGVDLLRAPKVIRLFKRKWIDEKTYPRFTMIGQSLGSVSLSWEALCKYNPEFYFDTSGYAFTYPLARLFGCKVICYTHYPTISSDMVARVTGRSSMYNNDSLIAKSVWLSRCKVIYYSIFSWLYGLVGSCAHLAMVNSSWTGSHIEKLWKIPGRTRKVYPPCDTSSLQMLPLERPAELPIFISVAQFRPEKAHGLQLEAFALTLERLSSESELDNIKKRPKLQFVGSCRNKDDENRLQNLKERCTELHLDNFVEFHSNVLYRDLVKLLGGAIAGLHSMVDEHFGISVVEYMAAGAIPIAHNSAGPRMDIVLEEDGQQTGFLANTIEEYAHAIMKVLTMSDTDRLRIASSARNRAQRFSEQRFNRDIKDAIRPLFVGA